MTVSCLLISGGFVLAVEGELPSNPGCIDLTNRSNVDCTPKDGALLVEVATLHFFLLAFGFGSQFCVAMGCLALMKRFGEYMHMHMHASP